MSAEIIQAQYDQLEAIARRFGQQATAQAAVQRRVRNSAERLRAGAWQGQGAAAFQAELNEKVYPALRRLEDALREAQKVTLQIRQMLQAAEEDAAKPFRAGAASGASAGGRAAGAGTAGSSAGSPAGALTPPAHEARSLFTDSYMDSMVGRQIRGADTPALNRAMETLAGNPTPEQVNEALDQIARSRGLTREQVQANYDRYLQLRAEAERIAAAKGKDAADPLNQTLHDRFMGTTTQLRYGQVVGDALGIDPVFGALLNPTGGLVGPDNNAFDMDASALGYHGIFHDAAGYLYNYHNLGPGYNYLGREQRDTSNPLTGQEAGIRYWNQKMGEGGWRAAVSETVGTGLGTVVDVRTWVGERVDDVRDGASRVGEWFTDLFSF